MSVSRLQAQWFGNIRGDLLAGTVVALALIPEAIAFSIIAGVDPKVGLYASFCIAVVIAFVGGRPGMISAATGAMALVMVSLVKNYGLEYLLAATILTGILQILAGVLRLGSLLRFVSRSVTTGFVNALAILIFMAQLPEFDNASWVVYAMVAAGLGIIYLFPYVTKAVPSPLIAIIVLTTFSIFMRLDIRTVGDMGELPNAFPLFLLPNIPLNLETLLIILPYSATLAVVGLLESLMTAVIVDDLTDTPSAKNQECTGQGIANIVAGFFGGMAGCAMIGQSVINVKSGGRGRLSTLWAGGFLLFLILVLGDLVRRFHTAAGGGDDNGLPSAHLAGPPSKNLTVHPKTSSFVMIATVLVVVSPTTRPGRGGCAAQCHLLCPQSLEAAGGGIDPLPPTVNSATTGSTASLLCFPPIKFATGFDFKEVIERVVIDVSRAHFWDLTGVGALDKVVLKFRRKELPSNWWGMNEASTTNCGPARHP